MRHRIKLFPASSESRPVTWVIVEEVKSGDWGIAGKPLTTSDVKALAAGQGGLAAHRLCALKSYKSPLYPHSLNVIGPFEPGPLISGRGQILSNRAPIHSGNSCTPHSLNVMGQALSSPVPSSPVVVKLTLDPRLPRSCRRPIAFAETLAASAIPSLDETRSQVIAPAIAAEQFF
jgi:hypothetical protein